MKKLLLLSALTFIVTNALFSQNLPSYVPTNGLVGYWPFNGNANDQSGNGNNGTVNGATLTADRFGNAKGDPGATFNETNLGSGWWCTGPPCPAAHNNSEAVGGPFPTHGVLLFDIEADPAETTDVASAHPDIVARLTARIVELNASAAPNLVLCKREIHRQDLIHSEVSRHPPADLADM